MDPDWFAFGRWSVERSVHRTDLRGLPACESRFDQNAAPTAPSAMSAAPDPVPPELVGHVRAHRTDHRQRPPAPQSGVSAHSFSFYDNDIEASAVGRA
jgi:hypothetical protein